MFVATGIAQGKRIVEQWRLAEVQRACGSIVTVVRVEKADDVRNLL